MKTKIGGQAVIEGVMMRGNSSQALACSRRDGRYPFGNQAIAFQEALV